MNFAMIFVVLGWVACFNSVFMLLPAFISIIYNEPAGYAFLGTALLSIIIGVILLLLIKPKNKNLYSKEGYVIVSLSWILMSILGALPLYFSGTAPQFIDALFESVSGFTTTGASIIPLVEELPKCCLFWRSFTHWVGGMGVLVFIMAFLPLSGAGNMNLMKAESPGPIVGKLVPRIKSTAFLLYAMYFGLTVLEFICLSIAGMPVFDAINTSFATAGTGGFGFLNDSMASVSPAIQIIITVFMILFGVNFNAYFLLLYRKWKDALRISEVWVYLGIILVSSAAITANIRNMYGSLGDAARNAAFTVGSVITTTGFSTADFNEWPELSRTILLCLMFIGACAGSTGGGIKVSRFIIMFKTIMKEIQIQVHPKLIKKIKMDGHAIAHDSVRSLNIYLIVYIFIFAASVLILSFEGYDFATNFSAVAATINNIGPGLELVGPSQNFAFFSVPSKIILIFDMLAGRLELFPMLILFAPATWKK